MRRRDFLNAAIIAPAMTGTSFALQRTEATGNCSFQFRQGRYRWGFPSGPGLEGARFGLDVDGRTLWSDEPGKARMNGAPEVELRPGEHASIDLNFEQARIQWTIEARIEDGNSITLGSIVRNQGDRPVRLGRCRLADASDSAAKINVGSGAENTVWLRMTGSQRDSRVFRINSGQNDTISRIVTQLYNPKSSTAINLGFTTFDRINTEHVLRWDAARNAVAGGSYCDFRGFSLGPGASISSEALRIEIGRDPNEGLNRWADVVAAHYHPRIWPKIPAGWVGVSWVDPFDMEKYESVVRRNVRGIRERLPGLDIEYVWVSFGNLKDLLPGNWLDWNTNLMPGGHAALVKDLGALGFKLGFWIGAFWINAHLGKEAEELHGAFLMRGGKPLVQHFPEWGDYYLLDPTHPKTKAYLKRVFGTYRQWGIRYYMIDFLNAISGMTLEPEGSKAPNVPDGYYDKSVVPGPQAFREGLDAIREAAGPDTYMLASSGVTLHTIGFSDAVRMGHDYGEGRTLYGGHSKYGPTPGLFYPATFGINNPAEWNSHLHATNALSISAFVHRKFFLADSGNVMTLDKPVPLPDAQITATIFGINGSPMMMGDDIPTMDEDRLQMIKQLFPRMPECARAVDLFDSPEPDYPKIFHLPVRVSWDEWHLLAVFNYTEKVLDQRLDFARLGIDAATPQIVWDFWNERYLGIKTGRIEIDVLPRSVRFLRIARAREHPWLLSTDMHVRQGQAEIENVTWSPQSGTLSVRARRPRGYSGNLFLRIPKGLAFKNPTGLFLAKEAGEGCLTVRCAVSFPTGEAVQKSFVLVPAESLLAKPADR